VQDSAVTPSDSILLGQIRRALPGVSANPQQMPVSFVVQQGVVSANGSAVSLDQKQRIIQAIKVLPGVTDVIDQIQINPLPIGTTPGYSAGTNQFGIRNTNVGGPLGQVGNQIQINPQPTGTTPGYSGPNQSGIRNTNVGRPLGR
jgi:hypothetical protein